MIEYEKTSPVDDLGLRRQYEEALARFGELLRPMFEDIAASERLTSEDYGTHINAVAR